MSGRTQRNRRAAAALLLIVLAAALFLAGAVWGARVAGGGQEGTILRYAYSDGQDGEVLFYHCVSDGTPACREALLDRIFDRESSDGSRPVSIGSQAGTLYWKGQISYLCWGLSPRDSFVLRYDHTRVEEDVMIRMAESVG